MRRFGWLTLVLAFTSANVEGGDAARGRQLYETRCVACHSVDANRVGPAHKGVVGRKAGSVTDYDYSPAVRASTIIWTAATLDRWLADPEKTIPGQRMGYSVSEARDRADLIAWLAQNSGRQGSATSRRARTWARSPAAPCRSAPAPAP